MKVFAAVFGPCALISPASLAAADRAAVQQAPDELTVLTPGSDGIASGRQLDSWLKQEFCRQVDRRTQAFEKLKSTAGCRA